MKKVLFILFMSLIPIISILGKDEQKEQYEIEIAEVGAPGTLVVRVWCYSKKPRIQDDIFRENAIKGILFKGVSDSGRMKGRDALVPDGYENHKDYFDAFFMDKEYNKYTRVALDGYVEQNGIIKIKRYYKIAKIVVISYNELRNKLEKDNIIKGLSYGF